MNIISHRANGFGHPANSLSAFVSALKSPVKEIEIDVRLTKDNVFVVHHDPSFRKYFFHKFISRKNFKEIQFKFNTLKTYLDYFEGTDKILHLDIKDHGCEKQLINELKTRNLIDRVSICSYTPKILEGIQKYNSEIKTSLTFVPFVRFHKLALKRIMHHMKPLVYFNNLNLEDFQNKYSKGFSHVHFFSKIPDLNVDAFNIPHVFLNKNILKEAKYKGQKINLFTINKQETLQKYRGLEINSIFSNNPLTFLVKDTNNA